MPDLRGYFTICSEHLSGDSISDVIHDEPNTDRPCLSSKEFTSANPGVRHCIHSLLMLRAVPTLGGNSGEKKILTAPGSLDSSSVNLDSRMSRDSNLKSQGQEGCWGLS